MKDKIIYAISDSLGETAESVARATASQYDKEPIEIIRVPYIVSEQQIDEVLEDETDGESKGLVAIKSGLRPKLREVQKQA